MLLALLACKGSDTQVNQLYPAITVSPTELDFGPVVPEYPSTLAVQVANAGRAPLDVSAVRVEGDEAAFSVDLPSFELAADREITQELRVTFAPPTYLQYEGRLVIESNDPDFPLFEVPLKGTGEDGPVPDIEITPLSIDFGVVSPDSAGTSWFSIENVGDGELHLGTITQSGSGAFSLASDPSNASIAAGGAAATVIVLYDPDTLDGDNATLTIASDDPDEPELTVTLLGNGGGSFEYPVADIACPTDPSPPVTFDLDGSGSYDPNGFRLVDYDWTLVETPRGSQAEIQATSDEVCEVYLDIAGDYEVQLQVTNEYGVKSAPARCVMDAIPEDGIHVELLWNTPKADVDLHLANAEDVGLFNSPDDVSWCNAEPSWGSIATSDDNPRLDIDDISGYGPENINILAPEEGEYPIRVHYFDDNGDGSIEAEVRVYINGMLHETKTKTLKRDEVWGVGTIRWPDGVLVDTGDTVSKADRHTCY